LEQFEFETPELDRQMKCWIIWNFLNC